MSAKNFQQQNSSSGMPGPESGVARPRYFFEVSYSMEDISLFLGARIPWIPFLRGATGDGNASANSRGFKRTNSFQKIGTNGASFVLDASSPFRSTVRSSSFSATPRKVTHQNLNNQGAPGYNEPMLKDSDTSSTPNSLSIPPLPRVVSAAGGCASRPSHKGAVTTNMDSTGAFSRRKQQKRSWLSGALRFGLFLVPLAYVFAFHLVWSHHPEESSRGKSVTGRMVKMFNLPGRTGVDGLSLGRGNAAVKLQQFKASIGSSHQLRAQSIDAELASDIPVNGKRARPRVIVNPLRATKEKAGLLPNPVIRSVISVTENGTTNETMKEPRPKLAMPGTKLKFRIVNWRKAPRLAICLVGGARDFELTGPSLIMNLLTAYKDADVFVISQLDENSHKLSLLQSVAPSVVEVRIAPDIPINESKVTDVLLSVVKGGPQAQTRQGLMQQFKSVEMCRALIVKFEKRHNFKYSAILRTRMDGYWMGRPPPLSVFDKDKYTIPDGSDWGGLNDRLGFGGRQVSLLALRRLSVLPELVHEGGYAGLNAEKTYLAQMEFLKVKVAREDFPFCILSHKKGLPAFPVAAALSSKPPLNGAKCRPCEPTVVGKEAEEYIGALPERVFGNGSRGIGLCLAEGDWDEGWETVFDRDAGVDAAAVRRYVKGRSQEECVRDWEDFRSLVMTWDAPPAPVLCVRGKLGRAHKLGFPGGDFPVFLEIISPDSVVYSMVAGEDYYFDNALLRRIQCKVHVFESTPLGLKWISEKIDHLPPAWVHHPWLFSPTDGELQVYPLDLDERPFEYASELPVNLDPSSGPPRVAVLAKTVQATMAELNHTKVDILRIGGHRSLYEALFDRWIDEGETPAVCQVIIAFHKDEKHYSSRNPETRQKLMQLRMIGLELGMCLRKDPIYESCVFFSIYHCP